MYFSCSLVFRDLEYYDNSAFSDMKFFRLLKAQIRRKDDLRDIGYWVNSLGINFKYDPINPAIQHFMQQLIAMVHPIKHKLSYAKIDEMINRLIVDEVVQL